MNTVSKTKNSCAFCGANESKYHPLIKGNNAFICSECAKTCCQMFKDPHLVDGQQTFFAKQSFNQLEYREKRDPHAQYKQNKNILVHSPRKIKENLDEYIIGQDEAKIALSVAMYNHYRRIFYNTTSKIQKSEKIEIQKSNVLMVGPSGSGKTLLIKTLAKNFNLPFAIADATTLTESGYVGDDVESVLQRLLDNARGDVKLAQMGIIYIDEIDKIAKHETISASNRVGGEGVQQSLLKMMEGTVVKIPIEGTKNGNSELVEIDTSNILFICGGAFVGLQDSIHKKTAKQSIGFGSNLKNVEETPDRFSITTEDLIDFGMIPEFLGRLPVIVSLNPLTVDDLIHILTDPKDSIIKQHQALFLMDNITLDFEHSAIEKIAEIAIERNVGARGLRSILDSILTPIIYNLPEDGGVHDILITRKDVEQNTMPVLNCPQIAS